ncbi:MAG: hypothetical protein AB7D36_08900, partial [Oscillospiraceae bacterium]
MSKPILCFDTGDEKSIIGKRLNRYVCHTIRIRDKTGGTVPAIPTGDFLRKWAERIMEAAIKAMKLPLHEGEPIMKKHAGYAAGSCVKAMDQKVNRGNDSRKQHWKDPISRQAFCF